MKSNTYNILKIISFICCILGLSQSIHASSSIPDNLISSSSNPECIPLITDSSSATLWYDTNDFKGVIRAIGDLQSDIERVTLKKPPLLSGSFVPTTSTSASTLPIIIGTIGKSAVINSLLKSKKIQASDLSGKWESFVIATVENPVPGVAKALVIAGSDKRGTIYGIYEVSKQLGVSPWYWWADVPALQRKEAYVRSGYFASGEPKVKYRGIFINDEIPALTYWAKKKFGGMNSKMYAHIFELILRLRGNMLWPGMWGSIEEYRPTVPILKDENGNYKGNSFNEDDPENPRLADEYGVVMGTSHHEPMQRSQQEWLRNKANYGNGEWNYMTNKAGIQTFFREGIAKTKNYESLVTIGMRGDDDKPMVDAGSAEANFKLVEGIMKDQQQLIKEVAGKSASNIQQIWTLYSEVVEYYDQGMNVPDNVIIVLPDDNWSDVRRLPDLKGKKHPGGYGMYFHAAYYGAPRAYKWLSVIQLQHIWEQMQMTYDYGVDKIWILNIGDIKPTEFQMDFFLKMAWDPTVFNQNNLLEYSRDFCAQQLGASQAEEAAYILNAHYQYTSRVTPEMLDDKTYNLVSGEFKSVRDEYLALETRALRQFLNVPDSYKDTYKELVLFPVQAMANVYDLYFAVAMNRKLAAEKDIRANYWAKHAEDCFKRDSLLCADYNYNIAGGKWNQMMVQPHIGYTTWHGPQFNVMPRVTRVKPDEVKNGGYVFSQKNDVVVMEAEHYYSAKANTQTSWTILPDLGKTLSCVALMPFTKSVDSVSLSYRFKLKDKPKSIQVRLILRTTMPFMRGGHRVAASINGGTEKTVNFNSDFNWKNNYGKMYPAGAARVVEVNYTLDAPELSDGTYQLTFRPLEPGVVFQKIVVDLGGFDRSFLKMLESPYTKN